MKKSILIFGTSSGAEELVELLNKEKVNIVGFLDNDERKNKQLFKGKKIYHPRNLSQLTFDYVVLGSISYEEDMYRQLIIEGVQIDSILTPLSKIGNRKKKYIAQNYDKYILYNDIFAKDSMNDMFNDYYFCSTNAEDSKNRLVQLHDFPDCFLKGIDYVRASTIELLAREIYKHNIKGAVAELGVYRGNFTKLINSLFPNRKLYLFDTFEGFSEKDIEFEKQNKLSNSKEGHFQHTNIETVLEKTIHKQNVVIRKGYFPDTTLDMQEESYAFVSIDVDLYKPTYEGLCYFYKRLNKGGYIAVHDYNSEKYKGVKEAVHRFCAKEKVSYVPLSDYYGSVIITK